MTMHIRRCRIRIPLGLLPLLILLSLALPALAQDYVINARVDPPRVTFDASSANRVTIWVTVQDSTGQPAPNMTVVRFTTTLGTITPQANIQNGQVVVQLENTQGPGTALVDISVGSSRVVLPPIDFIGPGASATTPIVDRLRYQLKGKQCYYSSGQLIFEIPDAATFIAPTFTVEAGAIQFDVRKKILTAQRNITLTAGDKTLTAEMMRIDLQKNTGALIDLDAEISHQTFNLSSFELKPIENRAMYADYFTPLDPTPTRTWILCREATIYPDDQIQFRRPDFYVDGSEICFLRLPYHILDLRSSVANTFFNSNISLTSNGGLDIDFPVYYAVSDKHIGSLHLRNVTSSSPGVAGLQLSLEEEYRFGNAADGAVYLTDLTRETRSVYWDHQHTFGKTHLTTAASYGRSSDKTPYTSRANLSLSRPLGNIQTNFGANWSSSADGQYELVELSASLPSVKLGKTPLSLNFYPYVNWQGQTKISKTTADEQTTTTKESSTLFEQGLRSSVGLPQISFLGGTISPSLSDVVSYDSEKTLMNSFDVGVRYQRRLFKIFTSSLGYSYGLQTSNLEGEANKPTENITFDLNGGGEYWQLYGYGTYTPGDKSIYSNGNLRYYLPWNPAKDGERRWFINYSANYISSMETDATIDHYFTLGRPIGSYTALLHYSPSGNMAVTGFSSISGEKWALELVRQGW